MKLLQDLISSRVKNLPFKGRKDETPPEPDVHLPRADGMTGWKHMDFS